MIDCNTRSYDTTEPKELHQSTIEYNAVEGILQYNMIQNIII